MTVSLCTFLLLSSPLNIPVHAWFYGDKHNETRDADIGDYENFIEHINETSNSTHKVFVFDSGDLTQVDYILHFSTSLSITSGNRTK